MTSRTKNTRECLITTAVDLIWKASYGAVSVDDICKKANVNKGSFYHYFPSKVALAIAAMDQSHAAFKPMLDEIFSSKHTPMQRFEIYADMGYQTQKEIAQEHGMVCGCPCMSLGSEMAPQDEAIRNKTDEIMEAHRQYYVATLRDMVHDGSLPSDTDIEAKSRKIYAFVMGQLMVARVQNSLEPIAQDLKTGIFRMLGSENTQRKTNSI